MAAADKARFYLEKSVPDLQELERKHVFTQEEIAAIVKKRSNFEHTLNGPGSRPLDYIRYATYEMNLDALRKKRCRRLGVKSTTFNGQRTIFFIFDRATRKFPGDKQMWRQYIRYCQKEQANKKLAKVFTSALRLAPRDWSLWVLAAKHYSESQGDMATARGYFQRGLRFCTDEKRLYLEYAKLELVYLAKLAARRKLLGIEQRGTAATSLVNGDDEDDRDDTIALPTITAEEFTEPEDKELEHLNAVNLERLANTPVMHGAVPIAIFDAAMQKFQHDSSFAEQFFNLSLEFDSIPPVNTFQDHILSTLEKQTPRVAEYHLCNATRHLSGARNELAKYPAAVRQVLTELENGVSCTTQSELSKLLLRMILLLLDEPQKQGVTEIPEMMFALHACIKRCVRHLLDRFEDMTIESIMRKLQKLDPSKDDDFLTMVLNNPTPDDAISEDETANYAVAEGGG